MPKFAGGTAFADAYATIPSGEGAGNQKCCRSISLNQWFKADLTHSQQLTNFAAKIDENQENVKKKEQVG